ncbi:MAG: hypothetical protein ACI3U8_06865 [Candidatus Onthomonas sp.]
MSCLRSEPSAPWDGGSLPCSPCCRIREQCPCASEPALRYAACRSCGAAKRLTAEAGRLLETVSQAENVRRLLEADRTLERSLSRMLSSELALADYLFAQTAGRCR